MNKIFISGLINQEINLKVDKFPIEYSPVLYPFFGVNASIAGVGLNISKCLKTLGDDVKLLSVIGNDDIGELVIKELKSMDIDTDLIIKKVKETSQSVIIVDKYGKRQIYCDLKDINQIILEEKVFVENAIDYDIICLCNINFSRSFLNIAKKMNKMIASDVHVLQDVHDPYNKDFMQAANILFMSDEKIKDKLENFIDEIINEYNNDIIVVGCGDKGSYMYVKKDNFKGHFPAYKTREVVNTVGAGDALFSSFIHIYAKTLDPYLAMKKANLYASYKIGENGASQGFINDEELDELYKKFISCDI